MNNFSKPELLKDQYKDGKNLEARKSLHTKYSTNKYGYNNWLADQYSFFDGCKILELGCGTGGQWADKLDKIGEHSALTLSDFSEGMVAEAKEKFGSDTRFSFAQIDIQNIPFEDNTFDFVIANMMLYHVPDISKGITEVRRVLKRDGVFYSATFGENSTITWVPNVLKEIIPDITKNQDFRFTLQNGEELLRKSFCDVAINRYIDSFEITDTTDLLLYVKSMITIQPFLKGIDEKDIYSLLDSKKDEHGIIHIPKENGIFVSKNS